MRYINAVVILLLITFSCKKDAKSTISPTTLKGEVVFRPTSDTLLLLKATDDVRQENQVVEIPIIDGKFNYQLITEENLAYQLIFKDEIEIENGHWKPIIFFPTDGKVNFKLNSLKDFSKNEIDGGTLNSIYHEFTSTILMPFNESMMTMNASYKDVSFKEMSSAAFYDIASELREASQEEKTAIYKEMSELKKKGLDRSEIGQKVDAKYKELAEKYANDKYNFIKDNPTIVSYYLVIEDLMSDKNGKKINREVVLKAFKTLKEKFPEHSYTTLGDNLINDLNKSKLGE